MVVMEGPWTPQQQSSKARVEINGLSSLRNSEDSASQIKAKYLHPHDQASAIIERQSKNPNLELVKNLDLIVSKSDKSL